MTKLRSVKILLVMAMAALLLSACGDKEPEERKAFIEFLNTHYINQPAGVVVTSLDDVTKNKLGRYVAHQEVIANFHSEGMDKLVPKAQELEALLQKTNFEDLDSTIAALKKAKEDSKAIATDMGTLYKETMTKKEALSLPEDLKPVYEQAFEKSINIPVKAFQAMFGEPIENLFDAQINLLEFVKTHKDEIDVKGANNFELKNPALQEEFNKLINDVNEKSLALLQAQQNLQKTQ